MASRRDAFAAPLPAAQPERPLACRLCGARELREAGEVAGHRFVECARCAFVFAPAITQAALDALYASGYHGPEEGAPDTGWQSGTAVLDVAFDLLPKDRPLDILDFGAGQSTTPERLRERGHRVVALDVAPPLRPHPDRLTGALPDVELPLPDFDLVYAYQVIEHLPEPRPTLDRLLSLVRPGGLALFHTDMEVPERARDGFERWWYVMPPDHNAFYRHRTFEVLLEGTPHRIVHRDAKRVVVRAGDTRDVKPGGAT